VTRLANGGKLPATSWPAGKTKKDSNLQQKKGEELVWVRPHLKMVEEIPSVQIWCQIIKIDSDEQVALIDAAAMDEGRGNPSQTIKEIRWLLGALRTEAKIP
jgi:hypothetical protein